MSGDPRPKQGKKPKKATRAEFTEDVRERVRRRSLGFCEAHTERCGGRAVLMHHIRRRNQGDGSEENALHLCLPCHDWIHSNVREAELMGWLIRSS